MRAFGGPCWGAAPEGSGRQKRGEGWPGCPVRGDSARCGASQVTIATPLPYTPKNQTNPTSGNRKALSGAAFSNARREATRLQGHRHGVCFCEEHCPGLQRGGGEGRSPAVPRAECRAQPRWPERERGRRIPVGDSGRRVLETLSGAVAGLGAWGLRTCRGMLVRLVLFYCALSGEGGERCLSGAPQRAALPSPGLPPGANSCSVNLPGSLAPGREGSLLLTHPPLF